MDIKMLFKKVKRNILQPFDCESTFLYKWKFSISIFLFGAIAEHSPQQRTAGRLESSLVLEDLSQVLFMV